MWDSSINLQYMPKQYITWWLEGVYRHSDIPYWTGRGGITPPGGDKRFARGLRLHDWRLGWDKQPCGGASGLRRG